MDVFVKILGPDSDEVRAAEALRHFGDRAAVKVLGYASGMPDNPWPTVEDWGRGFDRYRASGDRTISAMHTSGLLC
jgi:hypothetical protein